jgi:hypothetical protein
MPRLSFFDVGNYTAHCDKFIEQCSIILIDGGGNFGDLWAPHHDLRLRASCELSDVIILKGVFTRTAPEAEPPHTLALDLRQPPALADRGVVME